MRLLATTPIPECAASRGRRRRSGHRRSLIARLRIAEFVLGQADTLAQLELAREDLTSLSEVGGPSSIQAIHYLRVLEQGPDLPGLDHPGGKEGDLATFVIAEAVRDGLPTPRIAAELFATVPAWWPTSPYAPKALLRSPRSNRCRRIRSCSVLEGAYPGSPYLLLVAGEVTPPCWRSKTRSRPTAAGCAQRGRPGRGARRRSRRPDSAQQDELK